jgi:hypothetical protein
MKQVDKLKSIAMAEMKAAGVEFEERIAKLDEIEHPKPNAEAIYDTFNAFAKQHPWAAVEGVRPKSVAREMYETFQSFAEYIHSYELHRSEGLLLRYLSEAYKTLAQTVPESARTPEVEEMIVYFREMVRGVDSSLLDEWERMMDPSRVIAIVTTGEDAPKKREIDHKALTVLLRNELFRLVRALAARDFEAAAAILSQEAWSADALKTTMEPFFAEHPRLRTDPAARGTSGTRITEDESAGLWRVQQTLYDDEEANDWVIEAAVDPAASHEAGRAILRLERIGT